MKASKQARHAEREPDGDDLVSEPEVGERLGRGRHFSRAAHIDPRFSIGRHLATTLGIAGAIAGLGAWLAHDASPSAWAALPVFWLVANFFEWAFHRYPMHRPLVPRILYENHTLLHHNAFERHTMEISQLRELSLVMMPWYTLLLVFVMGAPIALVAALVGGAPLAGIFLLAAVSYFLLYEVMHTIYHLPRPLLQRLGLADNIVVMRLRAQHWHHHAMDRMAHKNFNVTFPLADWVLGTYESPAPGWRGPA